LWIITIGLLPKSRHYVGARTRHIIVVPRYVGGREVGDVPHEWYTSFLVLGRVLVSPRRPDPGDWNERPHPRAPRAPWWVALRLRTRIEFLTTGSGFLAAVWDASDSIPRMVVVVLVLLTMFIAEVREMAFGQFRRIVMERRLQAAFLELGICSRHRRHTPTILGSAARPNATVVRVWLPLGLTAADLAARRHDLAEVCLVDEVHVEQRPGRRDTAEVTLVRHRLGPRGASPRSLP
jgi:hypothetical protein